MDVSKQELGIIQSGGLLRLKYKIRGIMAEFFTNV